ncbi:MAG TPA: SRPBCC family protein [Lacunisphaera sp.]|nr:SRPBCC family protein [Lacunisphaera sp.]
MNSPAPSDPDGFRLERSVIIRRPPGRVYAFWREPANLGSLLPAQARVTATSNRRTHWVAQGPMGRTYEWDADITRDEPGRAIEWASCPGADVPNSGALRLDAGSADGESTRVTLSLSYDPPGGRLGKFVAGAMQGRAEQEVERALAEARRRIESEA